MGHFWWLSEFPTAEQSEEASSFRQESLRLIQHNGGYWLPPGSWSNYPTQLPQQPVPPFFQSPLITPLNSTQVGPKPSPRRLARDLDTTPRQPRRQIIPPAHQRNQNHTGEPWALPKQEPQKHIVDQVFAEDGSPLAELIHFDTARARDKAIRLSTSTDPGPSPFVDIVFYTDASARGTTKSDDPDQCLKEWDKMQADPVRWRSGVAIAWTVSSSQEFNHICFASEGSSCEVGSWIPTSTKVGVPTSYHGLGHWKPAHEAAWQVAGLQHFQQAELLGLLFALDRAVKVFQQLHAELQDQERTGTCKRPKRTITILTDSKPAMWDLTGFNVRTNAERTNSAYWVSREANTRKIVQKAKESMQILRQLDVEIKIQWTPGHSNVPGNEWVDKMSRRIRLAPSRFRPESLLSDGKLRDEACRSITGLDGVKHAIVVNTMACLRFALVPLAGEVVAPATGTVGVPPLKETLAVGEKPAEQTATAEAVEIDIINNKTEEETHEIMPGSDDEVTVIVRCVQEPAVRDVEKLDEDCPATPESIGNTRSNQQWETLDHSPTKGLVENDSGYDTSGEDPDAERFRTALDKNSHFVPKSAGYSLPRADKGAVEIQQTTTISSNRMAIHGLGQRHAGLRFNANQENQPPEARTAGTDSRGRPSSRSSQSSQSSRSSQSNQSNQSSQSSQFSQRQPNLSSQDSQSLVNSLLPGDVFQPPRGRAFRPESLMLLNAVTDATRSSSNSHKQQHRWLFR